MPSIAATAIVSGVAAITAETIATAILTTVFSIGLSFVAQALFGRQPSPPNLARDATRMIRGSAEPHRMVYGNAKVSGPLVFCSASGTDSEYLHLVVPLAAHEIEEVTTVWFNDEVNTSNRFTASDGVTRLERTNVHLGASDQAADADLVAEVAEWTTDHRLRGIAYVYVRLTYNQDSFPTGIPNISALVKGKKVYDPRDGSTAWSQNPALCIRDYLLADYGIGAAADEIDEDSFIAAANVCDELIAIDEAGTTQRRYLMNGVVFLDDRPIDTMEKMLSSCAGILVYQGGQYKLYPGAYRTPTIELTADDLRGPVKVRPRLPRSELFNRVRGIHIDPARDFQPSDFPPVENALYVTQDGGETITRDIELPYTHNSIQAQRLAKIHLEKSRQGITVELPCKLTALQVEIGKPVMVTLDRLGWSRKVFLPIDWKLNPEGGVDLVLQEEAAEVYDWNFGHALTYDPAPDTNLPDSFNVPAPTNVLVQTSRAQLADGTWTLALLVTWTAPSAAFTLEYEVQWKAPGDADWNSYLTRNTRYFIAPVANGITYSIRVRAINALGVRSPWASASDTAPTPDTTPPAVPTGLTATGGVRQIALRWTNPGDADLRHVEIYENTVNSLGSAYKMGESASDYFIRSGLDPLATRYFWVRAVDRSSNASGFTSAVSATTSQLIASDIADGIINTAKFAQGITFPEIVSSFPTTGNFRGRLIFYTPENQIYRYTGSQWTAEVDGTKLKDGSVVFGKIAVGAVGADQIAGQQIFGRHMAAETIISQSIQVGSGVIGKAQIADASIDFAKIEDLSVGTLKIRDGALTNAVAGAGASISLSVATSGTVVILLMARIQGYTYSEDVTATADGYLQLFWNGNPVRRSFDTVRAGAQKTVPMLWTHNPGTGISTYSLTWTSTGGISPRGSFLVDTNTFWHVVEYKR